MINAVQQVIYEAINGIAGLGAEVYEGAAPQKDAAYPYVVIDPMQTADNTTSNELTDCFAATFNVHVWDDEKSSFNVAVIQKKIYDELHLSTSLAPTGYLVSIVRQESSNIFLDPDGITRHGVQVFEIVFETPITYTY